MTPRQCPYCKEWFPPAQHNQIICKKPACEKAWHRDYYAANKDHLASHQPRPRFCDYCGKSLVGTPFKSCCPAKECREKRQAARMITRKAWDTGRLSKRRKMKGEKSKVYICQRCGDPIKNGNRLHCEHCNRLASVYAPECVGFGVWLT
jgi:hypothetical protein